MAKGNGQRLKALYILKILQENSDEKHLLKTQQIIDRLEGYGIPAERKSVYADIIALKELGYEMKLEESSGDHQWKYWDAKIQDVLRWWLDTDLDLT